MATKTQKLDHTLFTVQYAKGESVFHSKGHEVLEIATPSGNEVVNIISANERIKAGQETLGQALMDAGITIHSANAAAVRQVFGRTVVYARLKVWTDDRKVLSDIMSKVNQSAIV